VPVHYEFEEGEGERFLRGIQRTDSSGVAEFETIVAGWYRTRTAHIHVIPMHSSGLRACLGRGDVKFSDVLSVSLRVDSQPCRSGKLPIRSPLAMSRHCMQVVILYLTAKDR
jgi:hypothetical protein